MKDLTNIDKARAGWGEDLPDWICALAEHADRHGQRGTAKLLKRSNGFVSRMINNNYEAKVKEAEALVRARLMGATVDCPEWGWIPTGTCLRHRNRTDPPTNFYQRRFAEACPVCPLNPDRKDDD